MCGIASSSSSPPTTRRRTTTTTLMTPSTITTSSSVQPSPPVSVVITSLLVPSTIVSVSILVSSVDTTSIYVPLSTSPSITIASSITPAATVAPLTFNPSDSQLSPDTLAWMQVINLSPPRQTTSAPSSPSVLHTTLQFPYVPPILSFGQTVLTPVLTAASRHQRLQRATNRCLMTHFFKQFSYYRQIGLILPSQMTSGPTRTSLKTMTTELHKSSGPIPHKSLSVPMYRLFQLT
ncbi:hypothetical protein O6H91_23G071900 [Diphasiastrum complanatum]|uniref:Uncharacterized protein n=1 Tax=Diphasiastrum complanatum TaxID=34168 RepID=A0ACC2AC72_DIPCM|nr:hypothetical protein O6H91_23G071900 [Diphasiastrum complanatum]